MCVEPNDAERHSLHESDAEISELETEILALKVERKKLLNIEWNLTSLFLKKKTDSTILILPNPTSFYLYKICHFFLVSESKHWNIIVLKRHASTLQTTKTQTVHKQNKQTKSKGANMDKLQISNE